MTVYKAKERNKLKMRIFEYNKRRTAMKNKKPKRTDILSVKTHERRLENYATKIATWRRTIRRLDRRSNAIIALANHIAYFTAYNVKGSGSKKGSMGIEQAKGLFCKWGMENGIPGISLSEYMGHKDNEMASRIRMRFTKSFQKKPENKELWDRFKLYYDDLLVNMISEKNIEKDLE